jgi:micrococcal nuclease
MKTIALFITLLSFLLTENFEAKVIRVTDGDTIVVLDKGNTQIKVRLDGIDCPESHQDFGDRAKQAINAEAFDNAEKNATNNHL